jgi:hypothetical protein
MSSTNSQEDSSSRAPVLARFERVRGASGFWTHSAPQGSYTVRIDNTKIIGDSVEEIESLLQRLVDLDYATAFDVSENYSEEYGPDHPCITIAREIEEDWDHRDDLAILMKSHSISIEKAAAIALACDIEKSGITELLPLCPVLRAGREWEAPRYTSAAWLTDTVTVDGFPEEILKEIQDVSEDVVEDFEIDGASVSAHLDNLLYEAGRRCGCSHDVYVQEFSRMVRDDYADACADVWEKVVKLAKKKGYLSTDEIAAEIAWNKAHGYCRHGLDTMTCGWCGNE